MRMWPQVAWSAFIQRCVRLLSLTIAVGLSLCALAIVSGLLYARHKALLARYLLADLRALTIEHSMTADVLPIVTHYGGLSHDPSDDERPCPPTRCTYTFLIDTVPLAHLYGHGALLDKIIDKTMDLLDSETLNWIGLRPWQMLANVSLENSRLESYSYAIYVERPCHKWLNAGWRVAPRLPEAFLRPNGRSEVSPNRLLITWNHLHMGLQTGEGLTAYMVPSATAEERQAVFNLNTGCLVRLGRGCFLLGEIFPGAASWQRGHGSWPLGWTSQTCRGMKDP